MVNVSYSAIARRTRQRNIDTEGISTSSVNTHRIAGFGWRGNNLPGEAICESNRAMYSGGLSKAHDIGRSHKQEFIGVIFLIARKFDFKIFFLPLK